MSQINLINPIYRKELDYSILQQLEKLDEESFRKFIHTYESKRKQLKNVYLAWFFGLHYGYIEDWSTQALYMFSLAVLIGLIWYFVDIFRIPNLTKIFNNNLAVEIISQHSLKYK